MRNRSLPFIFQIYNIDNIWRQTRFFFNTLSVLSIFLRIIFPKVIRPWLTGRKALSCLVLFSYAEGPSIRHIISCDAINEIRRTPHWISASGDALRYLLRCTVNFSISASVVEALILRYCPKHFTVKKVNKMAATETLI